MGGLDATNPNNLRYRGEAAHYSIRGGLRGDMDSLKVSIVIESLQGIGGYQKYRNKADLYENRQVERMAREASDKFDVRADLIELDLHRLTDFLEEYRDRLYVKGKDQTGLPVIKTDPAMVARCRKLFSGPDLIERLNQLNGVFYQYNTYFVTKLGFKRRDRLLR